MRQILKTILLFLLLALADTTCAQVKDLKDIKARTPYLLRNTNGYGYCIYNPAIDDKNPTIGEAEVNHPSGCVNDMYRNAIDPRDKNNQWYIESDGKDGYLLRNVGNNSLITNETLSWGGWGGWGQIRSYGIWFFTEETIPVTIESWTEGVWLFRTSNAALDNVSTAYLCAASHSQTAMANWKPEDAGSTWEILTVEDDVKLYHKDSAGEDVNPGIDIGQDELGEVPVEGDIRYFCFLDSQLIAIPEQFILDREEDEQFLTLKLWGDTTITLSKYALDRETTEAPGDLPVMESFKFNNKFDDQLYSDAEGVINNDSNTIVARVPVIGKSLVASVKLPDEEDKLGTKVWVDGRLNVSKVTRRRFDQDFTYTVARPRQYVFKVIKTRNEVWSTEPEDTEEQWIISPVELDMGMISTNWPSSNSDQRLEFILDGNTDSYFHSDWSSNNNWSEGSYYGDGKTTWPYLQIEMAEPLENFQFSYATRKGDSNGGYAPQGFIIMGSQDGKAWDEVATLEKDRDQLPVGGGVSYTSPIIQLDRPYGFLRLQLTESTRKNYLVLSEFSMNKVEVNPDYGKNKEDFVPEIISPAEYKTAYVPYGREYKVHVDFLTEQSVAEYRVPRIDIWFGDRKNWSSSMWIGRYGKTVYEDATMAIDGAGIYPDMEETPLQIRGRGNSSWSSSWSSKNPYRLKFAEKVKPFGMTKGKSWVLLANKQSGSMTTNALAMKIADMVESDGCNHIIPVELYVNGQYRGSYNFTEKVGFANNSISLEDESNAAMLELDSYYDETYRFRDQNFNLYVNVKEPDFDDPECTSQTTFDFIKNSFNNFTYSVRNGSHVSQDYTTSAMDVNSLVRAWLVTDLTRNSETQHPKSWYIYTDDATYGHSPWHLGPVWDFDWSYGYEGTSTYFINHAETDILNYGGVGTPFFRQLIKSNDLVKKEYYRLWTHFMEEGRLEELIDYCDDYFAFVEPSLQHNATKWSDGRQYATVTENAKKWLRKRANWIYKRLEVYDLGEDIVDPWENENWGEPDGELNAEKPTLIIDMAAIDKPQPVYNLNGQKVATLSPSQINGTNLLPGIYIVGGRKVIVR